MKKIIFGIIFLIAFTNVKAEIKQILGVGFGQNTDEAKKEALADLATQISVDIKSDFEKVQKVLNNEVVSSSAKKIIKSSAEIPLLGVKFEYPEQNKVIAVISSDESLKAYLSEIEKLTEETKKLKKLAEETDDSSIKYDYLLKILGNLQLLDKYKSVAIILGQSDFPSLEITENEVKDSLTKIENTPDSLGTVINILAKDLKYKKIYIFPAKPDMSEEITEFSKLFKTMLAQKIMAVDSPENAEYLLRGSYDILNDKVLLTLNLYDKQQKYIKSLSTVFESKIVDVNLLPKYKNFDYALLSGNIIKSDLKVKIGFKGYGSGEGIDLNRGDKVSLVINTNLPICFYIVGHVFNSVIFCQ